MAFEKKLDIFSRETTSGVSTLWRYKCHFDLPPWYILMKYKQGIMEGHITFV